MDESAECAIIRRWFEEGWNERNPDLIDTMFAPGFTAEGGPHGTLDRLSYKQYFLSVTAASPDMQCEIIQLYDSGGFVVSHILSVGTLSHTFAGMEASGKKFTTDIIDIWKVDDGLISERMNAEFDSLGIKQQVGSKPYFKPE